MVEENEDDVFWVVTKSGSFSVKSLLSILEKVRIGHFPTSIVWNDWVPPKVSFFCLGGNMGESFDFRPIAKERVVFSQ